MATITPFDYHSNDANHGNYQYITLKEIVDGFVIGKQDDDHILKNTKRSIILKHVKDGIRKLNKQVFKDVLAVEITVPENLSLTLPHNYVDYVRVSLVILDNNTNSYRLKVLNLNGNINIAEGYLQDHNYDILFDDNGRILTADASNTYNKPYKRYLFNGSIMGGYSELDTSELSKYGEFKIDERRGEIVFSSDLYDKEIVLEYLSDGLAFDTYGEGNISVHKDAVETLKNWAYFAIIEHKLHVSQTEKNRALLRFKTTRHQAKLDRANIDILEIARALNSYSKNL